MLTRMALQEVGEGLPIRALQSTFLRGNYHFPHSPLTELCLLARYCHNHKGTLFRSHPRRRGRGPLVSHIQVLFPLVCNCPNRVWPQALERCYTLSGEGSLRAPSLQPSSTTGEDFLLSPRLPKAHKKQLFYL